MNLYVRKSTWFYKFAGLLAIICLGLSALITPNQVEAFQEPSTPSGIIITVIYTDPMNVRAGPGTFYDIIGQLFPGDIRPALGISPGREWIQILFEGGNAWVYAPYVTVSGGELQVVEPPPTPTPLVTSTIDATLAAAFNLQPTVTRLPTFPPPPPMTVPQFAQADPPIRSPVPFGYFVLILGISGALGLIYSLISKR